MQEVSPLSLLSDELSSSGKFASEMSGQTVPADFSGHMLDLDEDEDLEVFSKVKETPPPPETSRKLHFETVPLASLLRGFDRVADKRALASACGGTWCL